MVGYSAYGLQTGDRLDQGHLEHQDDPHGQEGTDSYSRDQVPSGETPGPEESRAGEGIGQTCRQMHEGLEALEAPLAPSLLLEGGNSQIRDHLAAEPVG